MERKRKLCNFHSIILLLSLLKHVYMFIYIYLYYIYIYEYKIKLQFDFRINFRSFKTNSETQLCHCKRQIRLIISYLLIINVTCFRYFKIFKLLLLLLPSFSHKQVLLLTLFLRREWVAANNRCSPKQIFINVVFMYEKS